ncbi:hypothetical protein pb186bvf_010250 [Paramecium bursaria]
MAFVEDIRRFLFFSRLLMQANYLVGSSYLIIKKFQYMTITNIQIYNVLLNKVSYDSLQNQDQRDTHMKQLTSPLIWGYKGTFASSFMNIAPAQNLPDFNVEYPESFIHQLQLNTIQQFSLNDLETIESGYTQGSSPTNTTEDSFPEMTRSCIF